MIKTINLNSDVPKVKPNTSRIFVFDVSGSMYDSLPKMKRHLKEKLFDKIPEGDDISIIYFSGKGQYGVLVEGVNVAKVKDLKQVYAKIDSLQTIGLTGFLEPLKEVETLVDRLPKETVKDLFFLTDGYDNQWSEKEILNQCLKLREKVDHAYVVEYGWYCNRPLIEKMTEVLAATHLFSEDYISYEDLAEKAITEGVTKKIKVQLPETPQAKVAFYFYNGNISTVSADTENTILVPEDLDKYYFLDADLNKTEITIEPTKEAYMALYVLASKKESSSVYNLLKKLGDVRFIQQYTNTFGKQDLTKFLEDVADAVTNETSRMSKGCNYNLVPKEDAYTVLDLLQDLMKPGNRLYPDHEDFQYKRIGRAKETVSVAERIEKAKEALSTTQDVNELKEKTEEMLNLLSTTDLKFEADKTDNGIEISNLTWNEDRPNVSVLIKRTGHVQLPKNNFGLDKLETFIYRNYTIIKDGILNMNVLPVSLTKEIFNKLQENNLLENQEYKENHIYSLDFSSLPVINRKMVKTASATEVFGLHLKLETLKAHNKVFKYYLNELEPKTSVGWEQQYGSAAVAWLKEMGLTEHNGFAPKVKSVESTDFYIGKSLEIKVKGLSALPKVVDVEKNLKEGKKLSIKEVAMAQAIQEFQLLANKDQEEKIAFLKAKLAEIKSEDKKISLLLSKIKFAVIIGQTWFSEFSGDEDATLEMDYLNNKVQVSAVLEDVNIKI